MTTQADVDYGLQDLFATIEAVTGLDVSVYPPAAREASPAIEKLPVKYHRHVSAFCRAVRQTRDGRGCRGHDSTLTNRRAAEVGRPFVQVCHAGAAEVIVPVIYDGRHLATVFIGQAVIESVENEGFDGIWARIKDRGCERAEVEAGFRLLPRLPEARLLQIGRLAEAAIRGIADRLSLEAFAREVRLQNAPPVRRALELLRQEENWHLTEAQMARRLHLTPAYFCRLFRKALGRGYNRYLTELRLRRTQNLLQQTDLSVGEIASRCGFSRQSYFTRRFRELTGQSPSEFRSRRS